MNLSIRLIVPPALSLAVLALVFAPWTVNAQQASDVLTEQEETQNIASEIIGVALVDPLGNEVAEVTDLILDEERRVVGVVVAVGGFFGLGAKPVGLPWDAVSVEQGQGGAVAVVRMSEEQLAEAPRFMTLAEIEAAERARQQQQQMQQGQGATTPPPQR